MLNHVSSANCYVSHQIGPPLLGDCYASQQVGPLLIGYRYTSHQIEPPLLGHVAQDGRLDFAELQQLKREGGTLQAVEEVL